MKRNYIYLALAACLLTACKDTPQQAKEGLMIADVAAAMDNLSPLQLSELGSTVRYVPLETTDSCLIGRDPMVTVLENLILIYSGKDCFCFDKATGKFVAQIGHPGEDPQAYSDAEPYYNPYDKLIYFVREPNKLQKYDTAGRYIGELSLATMPPMPSPFVFSDSLVLGYYANMAQQDIAGRVLATFDGQGNLQDTVAGILPSLPPMNVNDIASISVKRLGTPVFIYTRFQDGTASGNILNCPVLWTCDGQIRFKEQFIDTVYTVEGNRLRPALAFHTGKWHLGAEAQHETSGTRDKLLPVTVLETPEKVFFQCAQGLYENIPTMLNGIYDKQTGSTHMASTADGLTDDVNGFLPFMPQTCTLQGAFAGILPAEDVEEWMAGHPEAKNNSALAPLAGVKAEDNPVVVIVESGL